MIEIITGLPGFGKTLTATRWASKEMKKGKKVYANYKLKGAEYFTDPLSVLGKVENALIVVDEAGIVFDQLRMYSIPDETWMELRQHRKDGVDLLFTAQSLSDVAYPLRRLIQFEWNIYFKFGRFISVQSRNPQRGGDNYGRRLWYISSKVFSMYDTNHKVGTSEGSESAIAGSEDRFANYRNLQDEMLQESVVAINKKIIV